MTVAWAHTESNHRMTIRLTAEAWAAAQAEAAARGQHPRYVLFSGAMWRLAHISEACLLRGEIEDGDEEHLDRLLSHSGRTFADLMAVPGARLRAAWRLQYHAPRAVIPTGWAIDLDGEPLPRQCGLSRIHPPLFPPTITSETVFPRRPPAPAPVPSPVWTMADYVGHLGSHVVPADLGGSGGGAYPGTIGGGDVVAILDGIHYLIRTPNDPSYAEILRALPAATWIRPAGGWRVKKRWHRMITSAIREIEDLERQRAERIETLAADLGHTLGPWATLLPDGAAQVALPPRAVRSGALLSLLRRIDAPNGLVPPRRVPDLRLAAPEIDAALAESWAELARQDAAEEARRAETRALRALHADAAAAARARAAAARIERFRWRTLVPAEDAPAIGSTIRVRGVLRRVVDLGAVLGGDTDQSLFGVQRTVPRTPLTRYVYTAAIEETHDD